LSASASRRKSSTPSDVAAGIVFQNPVLLEWRTALGNIMLQAEARKLDRAAAERRACRLQRGHAVICAGSPACCATHKPPQMRRHAVKLKTGAA
jgi:ABC-type taurine transport system ATPase subunit